MLRHRTAGLPLEAVGVHAPSVLPRLVYQGGFALAALILVVGTAALLAELVHALPAVTDHVGTWALIAGGLGYLLSHQIRAFRLAVIIGEPSIGVRLITKAHFYTAGVSLLLPFKLGEIYRIIEFKNIVGSFGRSLVIIWIERVFDTVVTLSLLVAAAAVDSAVLSTTAPVLLVYALFVTGTVFLFSVLPGNLDALTVFIIRRYNRPGWVKVLQAIDRTHRVLCRAPQALRGKMSAVLFLSLLIWQLELGVVLLMAPDLAADPLGTLAAVPVILSNVVSDVLSGFPPHGTAFTALATLIGDPDVADDGVAYACGVLAPMMAVSVLALVLYLPARWHLPLPGRRVAVRGRGA